MNIVFMYVFFYGITVFYVQELFNGLGWIELHVAGEYDSLFTIHMIQQMNRNVNTM